MTFVKALENSPKFPYQSPCCIRKEIAYCKYGTHSQNKSYS